MVLMSCYLLTIDIISFICHFVRRITIMSTALDWLIASSLTIGFMLRCFLNGTTRRRGKSSLDDVTCFHRPGSNINFAPWASLNDH